MQPSDQVALLAAIREDPDNPTNWSVFADWLQSQNDPQGELIALELERDRCTDPAQRKDLEERIARSPATGGIAAKLRVDDVAMLPTLVERVRSVVIRELLVMINDPDDDQVTVIIEALAYMALRTLLVWDIDPARLRRLLASCPRLTRLRCIGGTLANAVVIAQAGLPLIEFDIGRSSTIGDAGLATLSTIASLRVLEIPRSQVGAAGIITLLDRLPIEKLVVSGNALGDQAIARICETTALRELAIDETGFTAQAIVAIAGAPGLAGLRTLTLAGWGDATSNLTPADLQPLIDSPYLSRDLVLELDGYALGLATEYHERDYAPEYDGTYWASEPTGPITERFRVKLVGLPS